MGLLTFWLHAYSVTKVLSFSTVFVKRTSALGEDFVFIHFSLSRGYLPDFPIPRSNSFEKDCYWPALLFGS